MSHTLTPNTHLIVSCAPDAAATALRELQARDMPVVIEAWLADGVALLSTPDATAFAENLAAQPPVFVRHLAPADIAIPLRCHRDDVATIAAAVAAADLPISPLPHAVQVRLSQRVQHPYTRYAVAEPLRTLLAHHGPEDVRHPQQVLAVYCAAEWAYAGLWPTSRCLSDWPGGERRFARTPDQVSRSEFKLLEALEVLRVPLPTGGQALDLGAAPGGWTRLLVERGLAVVAVDPAALAPRVTALPQVQHWSGTAEAFLAANHAQFDLIVNDMRMDARDSARLMRRAVQRLRPGGAVVMTLKLPQTESEQVYQQARTILEDAYHVQGARQLFHNRSEVTLALRRPS